MLPSTWETHLSISSDMLLGTRLGKGIEGEKGSYGGDGLPGGEGSPGGRRSPEVDHLKLEEGYLWGGVGHGGGGWVTQGGHCVERPIGEALGCRLERVFISFVWSCRKNPEVGIF